MQVAVIGLGYVGLPVAQRACDVGMTVTGFDLDTRVIANLIAGASHVDDVSDAALRAMLDGGFNPTSDESHLADCDVYIVCVPTPLGSNREPDLSAVQAAAQSIAAHLGTGSLVVIESTTYPGTTEGIVRPILQTSELTAGIHFHLAYSPERIDPGNRGFGLKTTPKIVGGLTPACRDAAVNFYSGHLLRGPRKHHTERLTSRGAGGAIPLVGRQSVWIGDYIAVGQGGFTCR